MISIRVKLTLAAVGLLAAFIGVLLLAEVLLLEPYYVLETRGPFLRIYEQVSAAAAAGDLRLARVSALSAESGYRVSVADRNGTVTLSSAPEFREGDRMPLPKDQLDFLNENRQALERGEMRYGILDKSPRGQAVLQLMAQLPDDRLLVITQPLEQLRRNSKIAVNFLLILGGLLFAAGIVFVLVFSARMTRPILELSGIARSIAALDFSARFADRRNDEIGILGTSVNTIAVELSRTIRELSAANEEIKKQMELQKRFLADISHEIRTPVGLIRGYAETLELGMDDSAEKRKELAGVIIRESERLERLLSDLLGLIRLENRPLSFAKKSANLADLLAEAASRYAAGAQKKGAALRIDAPAALEATFDPGRMLQVLDNLLSNAVRHAGENGLITIRAGGRGDAIRIEVENTGDPVAQEHLPNLFQPFYRADAARTRDDGGIGLGLAVVRGIVTAHGGSCGADNTDTGVCFWLEFPAGTD